MREFDALQDYPQTDRVVGSRTIRNRIEASYRGREFFDGDRNSGYGGLIYDGRWADVARRMCDTYGLGNEGSVLHLVCERGFLLHEFLKINPLMRCRGTETSLYARNTALRDIRLGIRLEPPTEISFGEKEFDLVIAIGAVYTLTLADAIQCLKEIQRVGKQAFVTLGAYETSTDRDLLLQWSLLGTTILRKDEWLDVMKHAGYDGDYKFVTAKSLKLCASS